MIISIISEDKMYRVEILEHAFLDLEDISKYIFEESFSREIAKKIHDEIIVATLTLKVFPLAFPCFEGNYRVMTVKKKYRIFYKVNENSKSVIVEYIFRTNQNSFIH